jgi:hypothetical protein
LPGHSGATCQPSQFALSVQYALAAAGELDPNRRAREHAVVRLVDVVDHPDLRHHDSGRGQRDARDPVRDDADDQAVRGERLGVSGADVREREAAEAAAPLDDEADARAGVGVAAPVERDGQRRHDVDARLHPAIARQPRLGAVERLDGHAGEQLAGERVDLAPLALEQPDVGHDRARRLVAHALPAAVDGREHRQQRAQAGVCRPWRRGALAGRGVAAAQREPRDGRDERERRDAAEHCSPRWARERPRWIRRAVPGSRDELLLEVAHEPLSVAARLQPVRRTRSSSSLRA